MQKIILASASIFGALSVMIGAFGAHGLQATLMANDRLATFETAVKYQFYHVLFLLALGILYPKSGRKFSQLCLFLCHFWHISI